MKALVGADTNCLQPPYYLGKHNNLEHRSWDFPSWYLAKEGCFVRRVTIPPVPLQQSPSVCAISSAHIARHLVSREIVKPRSKNLRSWLEYLCFITNNVSHSFFFFFLFFQSYFNCKQLRLEILAFVLLFYYLFAKTEYSLWSSNFFKLTKKFKFIILMSSCL